MKKTIVLYFVFSALGLAAQQDTMLSYEMFMQQISAYHPLSKKAQLGVSSAQAAVLEAKGGFDPVLGFKRSNKNFSGSNYYDKDAASISVPLPFGPNVYAGVERAEGLYLDPEVTTGTSSYVGIDFPVLKGLWMDERRAVLQKARIQLEQSEQARILAFNELSSAAAQAYWSWAEAYQLYQITENTLRLAQQRMGLLRTLQINGDRSEGDTIEVFVQMNQLQLMRDEQWNRYNNASIFLTGFIWEEDLFDGLVQKKYVPQQNDWQILDEPTLVSWLINNNDWETNPALRWYDFKLAGLNVEKKYKQQSLLPELNVSTRLLSKNIYTFTGLDRFYFSENYNFGLNFKMPMFFREGRGALQLTKIKIQDTSLDRDLKRREIDNKRKMLLNDFNLLNDQLRNMGRLIIAQERLYKLELSKFNLGESSVFLVNTREQKLMELKTKEIEWLAKKARVLAKINELRAGF